MTTTTTNHTDAFTITPQFVLAGAAIFTVHNDKCDHYTFRVNKVDNDGRPPVWFLNILSGSDNESDYTYVGIATQDGQIRLTRASKMTDDSQPVKVARWALGRIWTGRATTETMPSGYGIHGEGRCGRCGRTLTVPASVYGGFGPECARKIEAGE